MHWTASFWDASWFYLHSTALQSCKSTPGLVDSLLNVQNGSSIRSDYGSKVSEVVHRLNCFASNFEGFFVLQSLHLVSDVDLQADLQRFIHHVIQLLWHVFKVVWQEHNVIRVVKVL
jgi:hypothetical protein